jgi:hypothetical protein
MPRGPRGEKRPADVVGAAVKVARISVGDEPDDRNREASVTPAVGISRLGGVARAQALPPARRSQIAKKAAASRWKAPSDA